MACDHSRRKLWFGRKAGIGGHVCGFEASWIVGPFLRKIQRAIDERMTVARYVGSEDADLAVRDLARRTSVLPRYSARRLALLEKAGLVDHQDRIVIRQMLDDIVADNIAQGIRIPIPAPQDRLLPPRAGIASCLRAHPAGFALLISEQAFQKQACIRRNTLLPEQRTYPFLDLTKRRRPQRKRLFNRRYPRPRCSNHGCPWIQNLVRKATVMLDTMVTRNPALEKREHGLSLHIQVSGDCSPICARCRRCGETSAKQPVPRRAGRRYSLIIPGHIEDANPE